MFNMILIPFYIASLLSLYLFINYHVLHAKNQNGGDYMTLEQAREAIQKEYPKQEIGLGFEYEGAWYFRVGGGDYGGIHAVDNKTGFVTGNLPFIILLEDKKFSEALRKAGNKEKKEKGLSGDDFLELENQIEHDSVDSRCWRGEDFLAHHGIYGMHWGERRFQYKNGKLTPEGILRYRKKKEGGSEKTENPDEKQAKDGSAAAVVLALQLGVPAAISAVALTTSAISNHNRKMGDQLLDKKGIADTSIKFSDKNPPAKIEGEHSAEDDMKKINEAHGNLRPQTQNNCSHCSITMELRRRGFDVCARTSSKPVYTDLQLEKCFKPKPKSDQMGWNKPKNWDKMTNEEKNEAWRRAKFNNEIATSFKDVAKNIVKKYPEGARGLFSVVNPYVFVGHAMAFEVKGGNVIIYDTQTNRKFNLESPPSTYTQNFSAMSSLTYRLDNKKINWDGMNSICAQRIKKG